MDLVFEIGSRWKIGKALSLLCGFLGNVKVLFLQFSLNCHAYMQQWMDDLSKGSCKTILTTLTSLTFHVCTVCTWQSVVSAISVDSVSCRDVNFICLWLSMEWRLIFDFHDWLPVVILWTDRWQVPSHLG